jgi:hypothetical protein
MSKDASRSVCSKYIAFSQRWPCTTSCNLLKILNTFLKQKDNFTEVTMHCISSKHSYVSTSDMWIPEGSSHILPLKRNTIQWTCMTVSHQGWIYPCRDRRVVVRMCMYPVKWTRKFSEYFLLSTKHTDVARWNTFVQVIFVFYVFQSLGLKSQLHIISSKGSFPFLIIISPASHSSFK